MAKLECLSDESTFRTSRRALLRGLASAPAAASAIISPGAKAVASLHQGYEDKPAKLVRTKAGRSLSSQRYSSAEISLCALEAGLFADCTRAALHEAGAICKLALCAHLLDVGFPDDWNAEHIRQDISKALAYANATGLGHDCPHMARLALILTPYWKWGYPHLIGDPAMDDGGFTPEQIAQLLRALLNRVSDVTGHKLPNCCERFHRTVRS